MVAAVLLSALSGCSDASEEPQGLLTLEGSPPSFDVERAGPGKCSFDYRAQVSRLDLETGKELSVAEVPYPGDRVAVLMDGTVVVRSADYPSDPPSVFAVSADTGAPIWQREVEESVGLQAPQQAGDLAVTRDGESVVALRVANGSEVWRRPGGEDPQVAVDDGDVVIARPDRGEVELLDAATGESRWTASPSVGNGGSTGVVLTPSVVVTGGQSDDLVGIDRTTGEVRWEIPPAVGRYRYGLVDSTGGVIVRDVAGNDPNEVPEDKVSYLWALDPESGATKWRAPVDTDGIDSSALLGDLVVAPHAGTVEAIDVRTGRVRWTLPLDNVGRVSLPTPETVVIVTSNYERGASTIHAIDASSGEVMFTASLPVAHASPVTATGELLLVGGGFGQTSELVDSERDGLVIALNMNDGVEVWRTERREAVTAPLLATGGAVIALSSDPGIFCD